MFYIPQRVKFVWFRLAVIYKFSTTLKLRFAFDLLSLRKQDIFSNYVNLLDIV